MLISVVIPVYKAQECLYELATRLQAALATMAADYEILLIEDCGGDRSWEIIQELAAADARILGVQFSRNFGQHYGITAGLDLCRGDWAVVMDCDLQDRPEEIPRLYQQALKGFDVVLAQRKKRKDGLLKRLPSRLFYSLLNYLADMKYDPEVGNFRIISRSVIDQFCLMRERLRFFGGLVEWMGFPTSSIAVEHASRHSGKSTYTFRKLWVLATDTIMAYSDKPLRLAIRLGFALSLLSLTCAIFILYRALFHNIPVLGWSSLMVSIYFLGGIVIAILGVIGIYLGKTFDETKMRPLYIIARSTPDPLPPRSEAP